MLASMPEVSEIHCVKDAKVPLMRFKFDGILVDLPYAQLKVVSVPEVCSYHHRLQYIALQLSVSFLCYFSLEIIELFISHYKLQNVDILNPFFLRNIDETSWKSLSGVRANKRILQLVPNLEVLVILLFSFFHFLF